MPPCVQCQGHVEYGGKTLAFEGKCPFTTVDWKLEQYVANERVNWEHQMPSYPSWHDYPCWLYKAMNVYATEEAKIKSEDRG